MESVCELCRKRGRECDSKVIGKSCSWCNKDHKPCSNTHGYVPILKKMDALEDRLDRHTDAVAEAITNGLVKIANAIACAGTGKEVAAMVTEARKSVASVSVSPEKATAAPASPERGAEVRGSPKTPLFLESPKGVLRGEEAVVEEEV